MRIWIDEMDRKVQRDMVIYEMGEISDAALAELEEDEHQGYVVPDETAERWKKAFDDYWTVQGEIDKLVFAEDEN